MLEEITKNQYANDTHRFAVIMKGFYDNFLRVGFSEPMAREMVVTMVGNMTARANQK